MQILKRIAGYTRVSTKEQGEHGYSIDAQREMIENYCKQNGYELVKIYEDKGVSGKSTNGRLALKRLLEDAKKGLFDVLLVWKINRLARKQLDLLKIINELDKVNVSFRSSTENFETETPAGKLNLQMIGAISEFERNTIVDNVKMGMKARARNGEWNGGIVLGYDTVKVKGKNSKDTKGVLEINSEEAMIVKEIFELYASGKGLKAIVNTINHKGYKTKRGNPYNVNGVKDILHNPIYIGKIRYNVRENWAEKRRKGINPDPIIVDGKHDPIISEELWDKVQELYKSKSGKAKRRYDGSFPLTGILRCTACGAGMVAHRTTKKRKDGTKYILRYYHCGNFKNKGSSVCRSNGIRADYAEEYVFNRLSEVISNDKFLQDIVSTLNEKRRNEIKPLETELRYTEKRIEEFSSKREKYFKLFEDDIIDADALNKRMKALQDELEKYSKIKEDVLEKLTENDSQEISFDFVQMVLSDLHSLLAKAPHDQKKMLLQLILKKITITDRKKIDTIELHFNEKIINYFLNTDKEPPTPDGGSSFLAEKYKSLQLFMVRFTVLYSKL
ncbi:MAG: recombinase family protein [Anaeromicrobium sp.]|jgi:site-specific DNA recombinase|uniref:recombinase family protein n=1 Tax=Anaeromicrobium sp. TaxID=1929132 RepID=UPI0025D650ED|nr:recombinase family protein [Anaeromicrobium sp.]MCT4592941.1 recombinase family protein [Anaeromicrobium sp.]